MKYLMRYNSGFFCLFWFFFKPWSHIVSHMWTYICFISVVSLSLLLFAAWLKVQFHCTNHSHRNKINSVNIFSIHLKCSVSTVIHFVKYKHQNSLVRQHKGVWTQQKVNSVVLMKANLCTELILLWGKLLSPVLQNLSKRRSKHC